MVRGASLVDPPSLSFYSFKIHFLAMRLHDSNTGHPTLAVTFPQNTTLYSLPFEDVKIYCSARAKLEEKLASKSTDLKIISEEEWKGIGNNFVSFDNFLGTWMETALGNQVDTPLPRLINFLPSPHCWRGPQSKSALHPTPEEAGSSLPFSLHKGGCILPYPEDT